MDLFIAIAAACIVAYILYVITSGSGSSYAGNKIDDFIDCKSHSIGDEAPLISASARNDNTGYEERGKQILVLFGSEYGASEEVARKITDRLRQIPPDSMTFSWQPRLINAKHYQRVDLSREQLALVVMSTSGDGVPPTDALEFVRFLHTLKQNLRHLKYAVLALGDSSYPYFCRAGIGVDQRLHELGATRVLPRTDVDAEDWSVIAGWFESILACLSPGEVAVEPRIDYLLPAPNHPTEQESFGRHRPFMALLKAKQLLTTAETPDDKEIIHCEFDISGSGMTWSPGDALGIYPQNDTQDVLDVLLLAGLSGSIAVTKPSWSFTSSAGETMLCDALTKYYNLKWVTVDLLQLLCSEYHNTDAAQRLKAMLHAGTSKDNKPLHSYLGSREVCDVLREIPREERHRIDPKQLLACLRPLMPRYYSISSSQLADPTVICCTVAVVRYELLDVQRRGVCSTFLQDRCPVGARCPVFVSQNTGFRLPSDGNIPLILIGPGTGIAPFMAFLQERELRKASGRVLLYYGCRYKDKDFVYKEKLETWQSRGKVMLRLAFSREKQDLCSSSKMYVQHLLAQDSSDVWQLIQDGAHLYVCGDARSMAPDVHQTLLSITQQQGDMKAEQAANLLSHLEQQGRYQRDVWVP